MQKLIQHNVTIYSKDISPKLKVIATRDNPSSNFRVFFVKPHYEAIFRRNRLDVDAMREDGYIIRELDSVSRIIGITESYIDSEIAYIEKISKLL